MNGQWRAHARWALPTHVIPSVAEESTQYDGAKIPRFASLTRNDNGVTRVGKKWGENNGGAWYGGSMGNRE